jgi:hypothetical protein
VTAKGQLLPLGDAAATAMIGALKFEDSSRPIAEAIAGGARRIRAIGKPFAASLAFLADRLVDRTLV